MGECLREDLFHMKTHNRILSFRSLKFPYVWYLIYNIVEHVVSKGELTHYERFVSVERGGQTCNMNIIVYSVSVR